MKRLNISIAMIILALLFGFDADLAWSQAKKDLNQASVDGDLDRVKELVGQGANVNELNRMGMTPLVAGARNSRTTVCEFLVNNGADLNAKDREGKTALFWAVDTSNKELMEFLVGKGADLNITTGRGENALSKAKAKGNTEMADFLTKKGAKDPVVSNMYDEYYGPEGMMPGSPGATPQGTPTRGLAQNQVEVDLLADPNEIKARVKSFAGLEKLIQDVSAKSANETRYWEYDKSDNRTLLARAFQKQSDEEFALMRKIAVEEKAAKTTEAIDTMLEKKKDRDSEVRAALMQQRREATAATSSRGGRTRGSTRSTGRTSGRGYSGGYGTGSSSGGYVAGGGAGDGAYGYDDTGGMGVAGRGRTGRSALREPEPVDPDTEEEIRLWEQAETPDKKLDLAKSLHPLIYGDFANIREVAEKEEAKKTTAAIDGLLLARQERYDAYVKKTEEERNKLTQGLNGAVPGDPTAQPGIRTRGGRTRGTVTGTQQQQTQDRRRGRR